LIKARRQVERLSVSLAWRPEWPTALLIVAAWVALGLIRHAHATEQAPRVSVVAMLCRVQYPTQTSLGPAIAGWTLMSAAMMVPTTLPAVRHVCLNSIRRRRQWAMALYVGSFIGLWVGLGFVLLMGIRIAYSLGVTGRQLLAGTLAIGAVWQLTRWKRRALARCRRTLPLPPRGWAADIACARFALLQAGPCMLACWPLMLIVAVIGHGNLTIMASASGLVLAEGRTSARRALTLSAAAVLFVACAGTLTLN
jgi:predicted metal-binding membrane protein